MVLVLDRIGDDDDGPPKSVVERFGGMRMKTTSEEDLTVTVLSVVSLQVDVERMVEAEESDVDVDVTPPVPVPVGVVVSAGGVAVAVSGADRLSVHDVVELLLVSASGVVRVSVQDVVEAEAEVASGTDRVSVKDVVVSGSWVVCDEVSSVQVVSRGTLALLVWGGAAGEETVSPEVQLVEPVPVPEEEGDETVGWGKTVEVVGPPDTGGPPVMLASVVELRTGNGTEEDDENPGMLMVDPGVVLAGAVPEEVMETSTGAVPVGPELTTVELGNGNGAELDRMDDVFGDPVPEAVDEVRPPLRKEDDAEPAIVDALVALGKGNGAELEPVTRLVGAVTPPPVVGKAQVVEFDTGKGAEVEDLPGAQVGTPVPEDGSCPLEDPVPPTGPVPSPELPVGPTVGPAADEELLIGNGGVCIDVTELPGGPCTLVPNGAVPVGPPVPLTGPVAGLVPSPVPVGPEKLPDGPVPQVGPTPVVELEAGNGAVDGVVEGEGTPVRDVSPVPGAVPGTEFRSVPVPVADTVPFVTGKGTEEDGAGVPVRDPVPGGTAVPDTDPDPIVPGAVPDPNPGVVALPAGKGVEREETVPDGVPVAPGAEVTGRVPVTTVVVPFTETVEVNNKVVVALAVLLEELVASVADVVPAIEDEEPDVAADVDPTPPAVDDVLEPADVCETEDAEEDAPGKALPMLCRKLAQRPCRAVADVTQRKSLEALIVRSLSGLGRGSGGENWSSEKHGCLCSCKRWRKRKGYSPMNSMKYKKKRY
ncbi:hypothetical protein C8A01DRAFT_46014 [Parachaetomium inaequale]|uniref:Uncharacterized protein n=1 Tax=Parachaetomium inaequale TaxID=2588326 RepID=A0AAN6PH99_9PEZI|nr:hypothetical protein C8A01DRAFT_46014 [Parachaetomium inaequale]